MKERFIVTLIDKVNKTTFDLTATDLNVDGNDVYVYHDYDYIYKFHLKDYDFSVTKEQRLW